MKVLRDNGFTDRQQASVEAKRAALQRFKSQPGKDDPAVIERMAARQAIAAAREVRMAQKEEARLAEDARQADAKLVRDAEDRAELSARLDREAAELAEKELAQQTARDARYAARKAAKGKGK